MPYVEPALIMIHLVKCSYQISNLGKYLLNIKLDFACNIFYLSVLQYFVTESFLEQGDDSLEF
jgi:hypothetical protein